MMQPLIIPAILKDSFFAVSNAAYSVSHFAPYVQIDLVDGIHAPTVTWPFADEESVYSELTRLDNLPVDYELDLMIHAPDRVLEELLRVNAKRYIVHLNSTEHLQTCIEEIKKAAREVSVGVVIGDDVSQLAPVLASVDGVQCMGIRHIGKQGEPYDERVISLIQSIRDIDSHVPITVDGGVSAQTIPVLHDAGVSRFVAGSAVFRGDIQKNITDLSALVRSAL